ncbi:hypothetical protein N7490_001114 [Penicillium lividum]|nr:hypothetical protein N7490_001114 [Penicillium lividum]
MGGKVELITTEADFQAKVTDSKDAIIVDFFAEWCGPCKQIAPVLEKFSEDDAHKDVKFYKVDVDQLDTVAAKNKISAMPTFLVFKNGELVETIRGAVPPSIKAALVKVSA